MKTLKQTIEARERQYLIKLMRSTTSHTEAARWANVTRTQLFRLLNKYNLPRTNGE